MSTKKYYITTPIYYVNFKPHIGTSYTTILTDVVARFRRFLGDEVLLVTGSDEHSQNIADLAEQAGKSPRAYCDEMIPRFQACWKLMNIQQYHFERTSDEKHHRVTQQFWQRIYDRGDVYKGEYSGWYHTTDNRYLDPDEVPEKPETEPRLKFLTEESYFFRLSRYQAWLLDFHEANPHFVVPDFRRNEMLSRIRRGLNDVCISRSSTAWGIPLPWDEKHVFYVWIEALLTYLTGSGFDVPRFLSTIKGDRSVDVKDPCWLTERTDLAKQPEENFWPCDLHVMAKDIPWFHAVIWPAMLQSFGAPMPKKLLVHGYWQFAGQKMSKSLGNVIDPYDAAKLVGTDGLRYFLMREVPAGRDGNFNYEALVNRYNYDLANDLGNLVHRTVSLLHQLFEGAIPARPEADMLDAARQETADAVLELYGDLQFSEALQRIWRLVSQANQYIDKKKPWELKKKPERREEVAAAFYRLLEVIRTVSLLAYPVIPEAANRFWGILNLKGPVEDLNRDALTTPLTEGHRLSQSEPIFQRVPADVVKATKDKEKASQNEATVNTSMDGSKKEKDKMTQESIEGANLITIDDFARVKLCVGEVISAERVEKADKLLKLMVNDGGRERQVVSGIAPWYAPEDLPGKRVVLVTNLKPAKLRGLISEGMLLAAEDSEKRLSLVTLEREVGVGAEVR